MFGGKKIKEAEDKIQELEIVQKRYRRISEDIQQTKVFTEEIFADLETLNLQMDQGMNRLIDIMKEEKDSAETIAGQAVDLASGLSQMEVTGSQWNQEAARQEQLLSEGKKIAAVLQETEGLFAEISTEKQERKEKGTQVLQQSFDELRELQKAAKNMAALALNAAVEAGRLGETGIGFLQAAENVRELSEAYMGRLDTLQEQLKTAEELYQSETCQQQFEKIQQKTKQALQAADVFQIEENSTEMNLAEQVSIQQKLVKEIEESLQEKDAKYQSILEQMEFIQQNHTDSRKATGELEERLSLFYGKAL